jgi:hypothetical protein
MAINKPRQPEDGADDRKEATYQQQQAQYEQFVQEVCLFDIVMHGCTCSSCGSLLFALAETMPTIYKRERSDRLLSWTTRYKRAADVDIWSGVAMPWDGKSSKSLLPCLYGFHQVSQQLRSELPLMFRLACPMPQGWWL